jgi:hypothetical protein
MSRTWKRIRAVSLGVLGLVVCSPFILNWYYLRFIDPTGQDVNAMRWQESVRLASGEAITVDRYVKFRQEEALGMGLMAIQFENATLNIVPAPPDFVPWSAPIYPMLLDRDPENREWIVIGGTDSLNYWEINGRPCPSQWAFRLHEGVWYLQPIPTSLIGRKPNLLLDLRVSDDKDFTSSEFASVAKARKLLQANTGERIIPGMRFVGESYEPSPVCEGPGPPRFTDKIYAIDQPNLSRFPRMP